MILPTRIEWFSYKGGRGMHVAKLYITHSSYHIAETLAGQIWWVVDASPKSSVNYTESLFAIIRPLTKNFSPPDNLNS